MIYYHYTLDNQLKIIFNRQIYLVLSAYHRQTIVLKPPSYPKKQHTTFNFITIDENNQSITSSSQNFSNSHTIEVNFYSSKATIVHNNHINILMDKYCRKKQNNVNSIASFIVDSSSINYSSPFPTTTHTNKIIPNKVNKFLIYCEVRDILSKQKYNTVTPSGINKILVIYTTKPNPEIQEIFILNDDSYHLLSSSDSISHSSSHSESSQKHNYQ